MLREVNRMPGVSIIIISWEGLGEALKKRLAAQTFKDYETIVVHHVSPIARARNLGAEVASGEILIFLDDDVILSDEKFIEKLISPFKEIPDVGIVGSRIEVPEGNWIQNRLKKERLYLLSPRITALTQTEQGIGGPCMACKASLFKKTGGYNELIMSTEDRELLFKASKLGLRNYIVPTAIYHPSPKSLRLILRQQFIYGQSLARLKKLCPGWSESGIEFRAQALIPFFLMARTLLLPLDIFSPVSYAGGRLKINPEIQFTPFKALAIYIKHIGYCYEYLRIKEGFPPEPPSHRPYVEEIDERNFIVTE